MPSVKEELIRASNNDPANAGSNSIESPQYDPLKDIMEMFTEPSNLVDIDSVMAYTNRYKLELDSEIAKKRHNYNETLSKGGDPRAEPAQLAQQLDGIVDQFNNTKTLAVDTGDTINRMTANIKKLDYCKKNLTLSVTILKRLQMLVTAYDSLEDYLDEEIAEQRDYTQIRHLLSAVLELMKHFQTYKSIDEINTLNKKIGSLKNRVIDEVFKDFELELNGRLENPTLLDASQILDMLGDAYKDKLINWYVNSMFKELTTIFKSSEEAGSLDNLKRRFIFFQRILNTFEVQHAANFPKDWNMPIVATKKFCEITQADLNDVTAKETRLNGAHSDSNLLLSALSDTLEFENWLNQKFQMYAEYGDDSTYTFDKSISNVFEPYLNVWIDHQSSVIERKLMDYINPTNMFKKSGVAENENQSDTRDDSVLATESINVLESAADLFRTYRQILAQLIKLTRGKPLLRLASLFSRYLIEYERRVLEPMVPDSKQMAAGGSKEQEEALDVICLVSNTAEYCASTTTQLESKMRSLIEPADLGNGIDFDNARQAYLSMTARCMNTMKEKIDRDLQYAWREMSNSNWKTLQEVSGESRYLTSLKSILDEDCNMIFTRLNKSSYVRNFIDNLVEMVLRSVVVNIIKLQPITETMAEQMVLDIQTLRTFFLDLPLKAPNGAKIRSSGSYNKFVNDRTSAIVSLLKVLMVPHKPLDSYITNYFYNIKDSNFDNFVKTLKLKGLLRSETTYEKDRFKYLDQFKTQLRAYQDSDGEPLMESNPFLGKLDISKESATSPKRQSSPTMALPSISSPVSPGAMGTNISSFFNTSGNNFKNTRDNLEKNIARTFTDNKLNENFRNFGKFFKKGN